MGYIRFLRYMRCSCRRCCFFLNIKNIFEELRQWVPCVDCQRGPMGCCQEGQKSHLSLSFDHSWFRRPGIGSSSVARDCGPGCEDEYRLRSIWSRLPCTSRGLFRRWEL